MKKARQETDISVCLLSGCRFSEQLALRANDGVISCFTGKVKRFQIIDSYLFYLFYEPYYNDYREKSDRLHELMTIQRNYQMAMQPQQPKHGRKHEQER